jgi:signal transduction histidine kinase
MAGLAGRITEQVAERRLLLDRTVQATEEERVRIAANLHDGPIQRLAALGYTASGARRQVERGEPADTEALASLEGGIRDEVAALRQVMAELRPPVLDELGLAAALDAYGDDFRRRCGIACVVRTSSDVRLRPSLETLVCRLVHEALINVEKHAAARAVEISLAVEPGRARLEVSDDGVGFDVARAIGRDHFGLASMRQRVETAGGSWGIHSHPGRGTTITARLPTG